MRLKKKLILADIETYVENLSMYILGNLLQRIIYKVYIFLLIQ
jgi:hypothetical protein